MQSPTLLAIRRTIIVMGRKRRLFVSSRNMIERKQHPHSTSHQGGCTMKCIKPQLNFCVGAQCNTKNAWAFLHQTPEELGQKRNCHINIKPLYVCFVFFLTFNKNLYLSFDTTYYASFNPNHGLKFYQYFGKISQISDG